MKPLILLLLLSTLSALAVDVDCEAGFRQISASPFPAGPVRPWSFETRSLTLTPEQVFSREFISRLEKVGPVTSVVGERDGESTTGIPAQRAMFVAVLAGNEYVVHFELRRDVWDETTYFIEDLFTQNPAPPIGRESASRRFENEFESEEHQVRGLPAPEFMAFEKTLEDVVRAAGGSRVRTSGAQDYLVSRLYRSRLGMRPATPAARRTFEMLEELRRSFKQDLPHEIWDNSDHFRNILGTAAENTLMKEETEGWAQYQATGVLPKNARIYPSPEKPRIFVIRDGDSTFTSFIDYQNPRQPLLQWSDLLRDGRLLMEKELK